MRMKKIWETVTNLSDSNNELKSSIVSLTYDLDQTNRIKVNMESELRRNNGLLEKAKQENSHLLQRLTSATGTSQFLTSQQEQQILTLHNKLNKTETKNK